MEIKYIHKWKRIDGFVPFGKINPLHVKKMGAKKYTEIFFILPAIRSSSFSGGPNTIFRFAGELAKIGQHVHFISLQENSCTLAEFQDHLHRNLGLDDAVIKYFHVSDYTREIMVHETDRVCASASWTVETACALAREAGGSRPAYFIQDAEPLFLGWGAEHAMLMQTYTVPILPIINTTSLAELLFHLGEGSFAGANFRKEALVFQPSVDRALFYPEAGAKEKRSLFVYTRFGPQERRNLFPLALEAIARAIQNRYLDPQTWDIRCYGAPDAPPLDLGRGCITTMLPSLDMTGYAQELRRASIVLYLVLSPHTGYMPLEACACGAYAVTNTYLNKTAAYLRSLSPLIIPAEPTLNGVTHALCSALQLEKKSPDMRHTLPPLHIPHSWAESFAPIMPGVRAWLGSSSRA